eukprot:12807448-Alexandrium_andersonii.AAC.1
MAPKGGLTGGQIVVRYMKVGSAQPSLAEARVPGHQAPFVLGRCWPHPSRLAQLCPVSYTHLRAHETSAHL